MYNKLPPYYPGHSSTLDSKIAYCSYGLVCFFTLIVEPVVSESQIERYRECTRRQVNAKVYLTKIENAKLFKMQLMIWNALYFPF